MMVRYRWMLSLLLLAALILGAVQPVKAQDEMERQGLRFDAPAYAIGGPYAVGVRYFTIPAETETDRELTASVWYPAVNPHEEVGEIVYQQNFEPGQIPPFTVLGHAILDAEPDDSGAPYPLVVYTHAHWSMGQELPYLTEHLTSHGFVVISVDHEDNWSTDFGPMAYEANVRRPQEVTRQIDFADALSDSGGDLEGMIATEKVGIGGWSMGGGTSLAAAGARIDLDNLRSWCEEDPSHIQSADWACVDTLEHEEEMAEFAGLSEVPTGLWPDWGDERIAAAIRLSGSMPYIGEEGFAAVDVPVMLMHGGHEEAVDPSVEMGHPYDSVSSAHKSQVVFNDAGHFIFFSSCDESPDVYSLSQEIGFPTFCADDVWDMDRAHDLINHFVTAFLSAELRGDAEAAALLAPEAVAFPGVEYQSEGYGHRAQMETTAEIFVQGSSLPGLMDIAAGTDGNLYAASDLGRMIAVVDPDSGEIVDRLGAEAGVDSPTALTTGPDGSVYWSTFYAVAVCRLSPEMETTCQEMPVDVWGLGFAPDGRLFVTSDAHVQTLYELDPLLQAPPREVIHLDSLISHFAFGPDGYLYAPILLDGTIRRIDVDADPATEETVAEGLTFPWAVAFDSAGQLYATTGLDAEHNALVVVDLDSGNWEVVGRLPAFYTNLAIDADDRIYVSHFSEGAIFEFIPDGSLRPLTPPGVSGAGGLAVQARADGGESVFVAGWTTLHEFDGASGAQLNVWRSSWFPGAIPAPRTVAVDGESLLVTAWGDQWGGSAVLDWESASGSAVATVEDFALPANAIRFMDDLIVIDMAAEEGWQVIRTSGEEMAERHALASDFLEQPLGLAAGEGDLWVSDYATGRVVQLIDDGVELDTPMVVAEDLDRPEGIALAADGRLLVAETGTGRLLAINTGSGAMEVLAEGLGFNQENPTSVGPVSLTPYWIFNGVAVGPSGTVYVSGDAANVIYRIPAAPAQTTLESDTVTKIEALVEQIMQEGQVPGAALGIVKDGELVYAKGFGVAESGTRRPMTPETLAAAASLSKTFTAVAIMQLVAQGKIDLDAPVVDYLPYFKMADERYQDITVRHLLAHTSGIPAPSDDDYDFTRRATNPQALEDFVRTLPDRQLEHDPAEGEFIYSNHNYDILGDVIAKVSGLAYEDYVTENILAPLGMERSTFFLSQADPDLLTASHWLDEDGRFVSSPEPPDYDQVISASAGLVSNIDEMMKWAMLNLNRGELDGQQLVPSSAYDIMWTPTTSMYDYFGLGGLLVDWGLGWALADEAGHAITWWGGINLGSNFMMFLAPEDDLAVVTMTNATGESSWVPWYSYDIGYPVLQMLLDVEPEE